MTFAELKGKEDAMLASSDVRDKFTLRIHRAISWGLQAEKFLGLDERFIFYWISFNSIYGAKFGVGVSEKAAYNAFFSKLCEHDAGNTLNAALIALQNPVRVLLDNNYVYTAFWDYYYGDDKSDNAKKDFEEKRNKIRRLTYTSLVVKDEQVTVLKYIFELINTLRNQVFHGGSTYNGSKNREQLTCACAILKELMPIITEIVFSHPETDWNEPLYPVVED